MAQLRRLIGQPAMHHNAHFLKWRSGDLDYLGNLEPQSHPGGVL